MPSKRSGLAVFAAAAAAAVLCATAPRARAGGIFKPGDFVLAIDTDPPIVNSSYPTPGETPAKVIDGDINTKYLNFGKLNTGFIVVPSAPSIVQSFVLGTANDDTRRDPTSYQLFGTNSPISSTDNSGGMAEPWTMISSGSLSLPDTRLTLTPAVNVTNSTSYSAYKMIFPTVKDNAANSMQLGEAQFYTGSDGGGSAILAPANQILAVANPGPASSYPAGENPHNAINGVVNPAPATPTPPADKYLNFGRENSGLIVTPSAGPTIARSIQLWPANDTPSRDPSAFAIYGTNDTITSTDNSRGDGENWVLIATGAYDMPAGRNTTPGGPDIAGPIVAFANDTAYSSYKIVFTENRGPDTGTGSANSIQFAEVQIYDQVPEPVSAAVLGVGAVAGLALRRRRA